MQVTGRARASLQAIKVMISWNLTVPHHVIADQVCFPKNHFFLFLQNFKIQEKAKLHDSLLYVSRERPMGMLVSSKWISNNSHWWFQFFMLHFLQLLCWYFTLHPSLYAWQAQSIIMSYLSLFVSRTYRRDQIFKEAIVIQETRSTYTDPLRCPHFDSISCLYGLLHLSKEQILWTNTFSVIR